MSNLNKKTLLAIDPSSKRTGLANMDYDGRLIEAWAVKPTSTDDPYDRALSQCDEIDELLDSGKIKNLGCIVVEGTSGKINKKRHKGQGAGMSVFGMAAGAIWMSCHRWARYKFITHIDLALPCPIEVVVILENEWTNGVEKKQRAANMAMVYPQYRPENDPGFDIGDAIGLGRWYIDRERIRSL